MAPCLNHATLKPSLNIDFFFLLFLLRNSLHLFARPEVFCLFIPLDFKGPLRSYPPHPLPNSHSVENPWPCSASLSLSLSPQCQTSISRSLLLFPSSFQSVFLEYLSCVGKVWWKAWIYLPYTAQGYPLWAAPVFSTPLLLCLPSELPPNPGCGVQGAASLWSPNVSGHKWTLWGPRPYMNCPECIVAISCNNIAPPSNQIVYYINSESRKTKFQNVDL